MGWSKMGYQRCNISVFPKSISLFSFSFKSSSKCSSLSKPSFRLPLSLKSSTEFLSSSESSSYSNLHKSSFRLPPLSSFKIISILFLVILRWTTPVNAQGAFFRNLLNVPDRCESEGGFNTCSFLFSCYRAGGTPLRACGGIFLYACCEKTDSTVWSDRSNEDSFLNFIGDTSIRANPSSGRNFHSRYFLSPIHNDLNFKHLTNLQNDVIDVDYGYYNEPECGLQKTRKFSRRIIGGEEAEFAELPWQAQIRIDGNQSYQCGGVLLNRDFVATAAHCVHEARLRHIRIHLGDYDTNDTGKYYEPFPKESFAVVEKRIHPRFENMSGQPDRFDIAVLRLSHPVNYRENIGPICLPSPDDDFEGVKGIVAGWGKTDTLFSKKGTNILRKVTVPVISNKECLRWYESKNIDVKLHFEMFCAGRSEGKKDACSGDSGGPLVIHRRGRWRLAGITSAGFGCAIDHQPGIYHKVSASVAWIVRNIRI